jgi:hypothetical protein
MADVDTGSITDRNQMTKQFTDSVIDTATSCVKYKLNKKLKNKYKMKKLPGKNSILRYSLS